MTRALLDAHPDLVRHLDPDADRRCDETVTVRWLGSSWPCDRPAWRQVQGHPAMCGQHAARSLRRELQDRTGKAGGS